MGMELIPEHVVQQIFKLNLSLRVIGDGKKVFPAIAKGYRHGKQVILLELGSDNEFRRFKSWSVELKGRVDIESLRYCGEVKLEPVKDEPGYYIMKDIRLYKANKRQHKRVPYRRNIQITSPVPQNATMINISASGMYLRCLNEITTQEFDLQFVLAQKQLSLTAMIVEQTYNEIFQAYDVRCEFIGISNKDKKLISLVVKEITLAAKRRLSAK